VVRRQGKVTYELHYDAAELPFAKGDKMIKNKRISYLFLAVSVFWLFPLAAFGDLYWESLLETRGVPAGMPKNMPKEILDQFNKTETIKNYLTSYGSRTEISSGTIIIDFKTMIMVQLNPTDKTYTKIDMMAAMEKMKGQNMMDGLADDMEITPTNETKKIAGYLCKKYNVRLMGTTSQYWLSRDVKGYKEYQTYNKKMEKIIQKIPAMKQMSMASKLDGFPVQTVIDMMGMTSTTTLKRMEQKSLSKDLFQIPKGYKLQEMQFPMGRIPKEGGSKE